MRERIVMQQLLPCEPGWRMFFLCHVWDATTAGSSRYSTEEKPVIAWGLMLHNEDADLDPRFDRSSVVPVPAPDSEGFFFSEYSGVDSRDFLFLLAPGETPLPGELEERIKAREQSDREDALKSKAKRA